MEGIWQAAKDYIPDGRSIREILGTLEDPPAGNSVAADWTKMQTDAEVYAFLRITKANPIRLLLVLHRNDGTPDTPIAGVSNPYFAPDRFEPAKVYDDPAEDCDALVRNHAGVASRRMPTKDHTYEERKYKIHKRIQRQQHLLRMVERSHRAKFPNEVIYYSDHKDWCFIHNLNNPIPKTGPQLVKARAVAPVGHRAVKWNLCFGVKHIRAKIQSLKAAQLKWEEMQ